MRKLVSLKKTFTTLIVFYPILQIYKSPIGPFSLADTLLLLVYPVYFFYFVFRIRQKYDVIQLRLFGFCLIHLLYCVIFINQGIFEIIMNEGHFLLVLLTLAIFTRIFFDGEYGILLYCKVCFLSSIYFFVQFVLIHFLDIYISGNLSFLESDVSVMGNTRPYSFFSEPSSFGFYNAVGLVFILFLNYFKGKKKILYSSVISAALFLSLSTTSAALLIIVWGLYLLPRAKNSKIVKKLILLMPVIIILLLLSNYRYGTLDFIYSHVFARQDNGFLAQGLENRIGNYQLAFDYIEKDRYIQRFLGIGMIDMPFFVPAIGRTYMYFGILGYFILGIHFISIFIRSRECARVLIIMVMAVSVFGDSIFGLAMFGYMPYIQSLFTENWKSFKG